MQNLALGHAKLFYWEKTAPEKILILLTNDEGENNLSAS